MGYGPEKDKLTKLTGSYKATDPMSDLAQTARMRELYKRMEQIQSQLDSVIDFTRTTATNPNVVSMSNFVDNSDFTFSHYDYSFTVDPTAKWILAHWYARPQTVSTPYSVNGVLNEVAHSIRANDAWKVIINGTIDSPFFASETSVPGRRIDGGTDAIEWDDEIVGINFEDGLPFRIINAGTTAAPTNLAFDTTYEIVNAGIYSCQISTLGAIPPTPIDFTTTSIISPNTIGMFQFVKWFDPRENDRKVIWDTDTGTVAMCGGYRLSSPLASRYAFTGNNIYFKMQIIHKPRKIYCGVNSTTNEFDAEDITYYDNDDNEWLSEQVPHELLDGTEVTVGTDNEAFPTPLVADTVYYIINADTNTFQLSETEDGDPIDITSWAGSTFYIKTRIKKGLKCKVSIWDNTNTRVFRGDLPVMSAGKVGTHTGGTTTRQYLVEMQMPDGRRFYTDLDFDDEESTVQDGFLNFVDDTVSTDEVDTVNYVSVRWNNIVGANRYNIYRRSIDGAVTTPWYFIGSAPAGNTLFYDYGGSGVEFTPPEWDNLPTVQSQYQTADAIVTNVTDSIYETERVAVEVNANIQFPSIINDFSATGSQYLQIEFFKENDDPTDMADIPRNSLLIDKVAISYIYGRWNPSARDLAIVPNRTTPKKPIPGGGTGDGTGTTPGGGTGGTVGGGSYCVAKTTPILVWADSGEHYYLPASSIVTGDRLVSWNGTSLAPSVVKTVINGISRMNYRIYADGNELLCSFSHRVISDMDDFPKGTNVGALDKTVVVYRDGALKVVEIEGIESFNTSMSVVTFQMAKGSENYISNNIMSHNIKPPPIEEQ